MKRHSLTLASLAALALLGAGCQDANVDAGLTLAVRTDRLALAQGDTARFVIVLKNLGTDVATVGTPSCPHYFTVTDAEGRAAGPPNTICDAMALLPTPIPPGDSIVVRDSWAADSGQGYSFQTHRLDAGTYRIVAVLWGQDHRIHSPPLQLEVK